MSYRFKRMGVTKFEEQLLRVTKWSHDVFCYTMVHTRKNLKNSSEDLNLLAPWL